jgi:regulator of replication initiation timing
MGGFMTDKGFCIEFIDEKPIGAVGERFNYDYHDEKIIDNQTGKTYDGDNYHMLVIDGLLNQLNNENEQLKSSDTITDLETEIMNLKTIIDQLRTDNTKLKKKLNTAMKENEQLKCGNKNLKAILNDFINILNRLQCNPNNEQTLNVARDMLQNMGKELEE